MVGSGQRLESPASSSEAIEQAARRLFEAQEARTSCEPIRNLLSENDVAGAYAVQQVNVARWIAEGRRIIGRKIGLTSVSAQKALGVDQPAHGTLFADMEVPDGEVVAAGNLFQPRVEGALAFVLGSRIENEAPSIAEIIRAVDFVLPAIEVVDSRIRDWDIRMVDTIADNGSSGLYVLGANPVRLDKMDLRMCGMVIERNGDVASTGAGIACLGHPLQAVRWLARMMVEAGRPLSAGDVLLAGGLGPMVGVTAGDGFEVRISGAGSASVRFSR